MKKNHKSSTSEKVRRWRLANPERNREISRLASVRYRARTRGVDVEQALGAYLERREERFHIQTQPPPTKSCTRCHEIKPLEAFPKAKNRVLGRDSACKACKYAQQKNWARVNRNRLAGQRRGRYRNSPNAREQSRIRRSHRRAAMRAVDSDFTAEQWRAIKAAYQHRCAYCGERRPLTIEHVVPISLGGPHTASNIIPACLSCNSSKGARPPQTTFQPHLIA